MELPLLQPGPHICVLASFLRFPLANGDESVYAGLATRLHQLRSKDIGTAIIVYHILLEFQ